MQKTLPPEQITEIDVVGNDPWTWDLTGQQLAAAGAILLEEFENDDERVRAEIGKGKVVVCGRASKVYWIRLMLEGFAMENWLKALWVAKGNALYVKGDMVKLGLPAHDLVKLAKHVGFELAANERDALAMLSEIMVGVGRYPMRVKERFERPNAGWSNVDEDHLNAMRKRLRTEVRRLRKAAQ